MMTNNNEKSDLEKFHAWAASLGYKGDQVPKDDFILSILKSQQADVIYTIMNRIRPKEEVRKIRTDFLARKLQHMDENVLTAADTEALPESLKKYKKVEELRKKREQIIDNIEKYRKSHAEVETRCEILGKKLVQAQEELEELQTKVNIIEFKVESFDNEIASQKALEEELPSNMPVLVTPENNSKVEAIKILDEALKDMRSYYETVDEMEDNDEESKRELFEQFKERMAVQQNKLPNGLVFDALKVSLEKHLEEIMNLNNICEDPLPNTVHHEPGQLSPFILALRGAEIDALIMARQYFQAKILHVKKESETSMQSDKLEEALKTRIKALDGSQSDKKINETVEEYLDDFTNYHYVKAEIDFVKEYIKKYKELNDEKRAEAAENAEMTKEVEQIYKETNVVANKSKQSIELINQIKPKILCTFNEAKGLLHELSVKYAKETKNSFTPRPSTSFFESTESSILVSSNSDNIFSSTKLDASISMQMSMIESNEPPELGVHCQELECFESLPLKKLCFINPKCYYYTGRNPIIVAGQNSPRVLKLMPCIELSAYGIELAMKKFIFWIEKIKSLSSDLKIKLKVPSFSLVDEKKYALQKAAQESNIDELLHKIKMNLGRGKFSIGKTLEFFNFYIVDVVPASFIPAARQYTRVTFKEFETEFNSYYNIIKSAAELAKK